MRLRSPCHARACDLAALAYDGSATLVDSPGIALLRIARVPALERPLVTAQADGLQPVRAARAHAVGVERVQHLTAGAGPAIAVLRLPLAARAANPLEPIGIVELAEAPPRRSACLSSSRGIRPARRPAGRRRARAGGRLAACRRARRAPRAPRARRPARRARPRARRRAARARRRRAGRASRRRDRACDRRCGGRAARAGTPPCRARASPTRAAASSHSATCVAGTTALSGPYSGTRAPSRDSAHRWTGSSRPLRGLHAVHQLVAELELELRRGSRSRLATARHISASSCLLGLASASFFACFALGSSSCARRS